MEQLSILTINVREESNSLISFITPEYFNSYLERLPLNGRGACSDEIVNPNTLAIITIAAVLNFLKANMADALTDMKIKIALSPEYCSNIPIISAIVIGRRGGINKNYNTNGARYLAKTHPPPTSQMYSRNASMKGFAPAFLNLSMLVSAPKATIAIVRRNVSI